MPGHEAEKLISPADSAPFEAVTQPGIRSHLSALMRSSGDIATVIRGAGGTLAIKIVSALLFFTAQVVLARLLGVESYGTYSIAYAWLMTLLLLGLQGFDLATVRYVAAYRSQRQWSLLRGFLGFSHMIVFWSSAFVGAGLALAAWLLRAHLSMEIVSTLCLAAIILPVFALALIYESALRGLNLVVRAQPYQAVLNPIIMIACVPLAVLWFHAPASADTAMAIYLGANVISLLGLWIMLRRHLPGEAGMTTPERLPREWISASFAMMFLMGFVPLLNQVSLVVIGALYDSTAAGLYGAAFRIANVLILPAVALGAAIGPMAADFHARGDIAALQRVTRFGVRVVFALTLAVAIPIFVYGEWILGILGAEFVAAYPLLVVLVAGQLIVTAMAPAGILLNMTGHQNDSAKIMFVCALGYMVLLAALIPVFGALGAAIATVVTLTAWSGLMALAAYRRINIVAVVTLW